MKSIIDLSFDTDHAERLIVKIGSDNIDLLTTARPIRQQGHLVRSKLLPLCGGLGLPRQGVALILGVDRILDNIRQTLLGEQRTEILHG